MSEANVESIGEGCAKAACVLLGLTMWHNPCCHSEHRHETAKPTAWCLGWLAEPCYWIKSVFLVLLYTGFAAKKDIFVYLVLAAAVWQRWAHQDRGEKGLIRVTASWERLPASKENTGQQGMPSAWSTHSSPKGMGKKGTYKVFFHAEKLLKVVALEWCRLSQLKFMSPKISFQIDMFNISFSKNVLCFCRGYQSPIYYFEWAHI